MCLPKTVTENENWFDFVVMNLKSMSKLKVKNKT